jgi:hypothetical protein
MTPADFAATRSMTFTVASIRPTKSGVSNDGRSWTRFLITTADGQKKISTFEGEWQMFVGDTITAEVSTTLIDGKPYLSVGKPPRATSSPSGRRTAPTASAPDQEVRDALRRIELRLSEVIARLDAIATSPRADPDGGANGAG